MSNDRKLDHIARAFESATSLREHDKRFTYEPLLSAHPQTGLKAFSFLGKTLKTPIWVSSMTGGTGVAQKINENIARVCADFGMGMGLGSCRKILSDKTHWADFDFRDVIGDKLPFYANLGIAQIESLLENKEENRITDLIAELRADGLIIHVNPLQEWFQPEGDRLKNAPIDIIETFLAKVKFPVIVKEVGQGMGYESLKQLLQLPLAAIEFAAYGGTNFSKLELFRASEQMQNVFEPFAFIGQSAEKMVRDVNQIVQQEKDILCCELIISGGISDFLDGYYLTSISRLPAVFGMASAVLKYASESYEVLHTFIDGQVKALQLAKAYLKINPDYS